MGKHSQYQCARPFSDVFQESFIYFEGRLKQATLGRSIQEVGSPDP